MRLKSGVVLCLGAPLARALYMIEVVVEEFTGREVTITSGSDGVHREGSRHYTGEAIDIRTKDLDVGQRKHLRDHLAVMLGRFFDVVDEGSHIHIEYDPKE